MTVTAILLPGVNIPVGATFIIGVPSVGNVGQLATDSLLCTLSKQFEFVGSLESQYLLPMVGYESFDASTRPTLCLPVEVYRLRGESAVFLVQQRSLCARGRQRAFGDSLYAWLKAVQCAQAIVLTGAGAENVELLASSRQIFRSSSSDKAAVQMLQAVRPRFADAFSACVADLPAEPSSVERSVPPSALAEDLDDFLGGLRPQGDASAEEDGLPAGMTTARHLLRAAAADSASSDGVGVSLLGTVVGEGDNLEDGLQLAALAVNALLGADQHELTAEQMRGPLSWGKRYGGGIADGNMFY